MPELPALPVVGDRMQRIHLVTEEDIQLFAHLSEDHNPVHLDEVYARATPFGGRIAHGMYTATLISSVLGNDLPGPGTIYLGQMLKFTAPVRIGDTITTTVEVLAVRAEKRIVILRTLCTNQTGTVVVEGEATVKAP